MEQAQFPEHIAWPKLGQDLARRIDGLAPPDGASTSLDHEHALRLCALRDHQGLGIEKRQGSLHWSRYFRVAKCRDGYVMHCSLGDWTSLVEWVTGDGRARDLDDAHWEDLTYRKENAEHLFDILDDWAEDYSVAELMEGAQSRRIPYAMVRPPGALVDDPQLNNRGFFSDVEHPELSQSFRYPGGPSHFTATP